MKIAVLAPQLIPTHPAGGQMLKVVQALASEYEFTVFGRIIDESLQGKVQFYRMPIPIRPLLATYLAQFWLYGRLFKHLDWEQRFDVVHSIEASSPFATVVTMHYCSAAALTLVRQGVLRYRGIRKPYYRLLYEIMSREEQYVVNNPYLKRLIVVSEGLKREILHHYHPSVEPVVIPNSVDVDRFVYSKQRRELIRREIGSTGNEVIGIICALGDWQRKGLDVLIEAVALLPQNSIKILVVGGGPIQTYRKLCEKRGVVNAFLFTGFVRDVERFYGAGDFFILPTAYETFSLVAIEAAAAGLPLLVTRVNGLEGFVEEGINGFFVQREPRSIANAIIALINNPDKLKHMGIEAQRRAQAFRVENMVDAYRQLYQKMK
jgi:glycosyltransferase involved in cell wall biosynthesis